MVENKGGVDGRQAAPEEEEGDLEQPLLVPRKAEQKKTKTKTPKPSKPPKPPKPEKKSDDKEKKRRPTWFGGLAQAFAFSWPSTFCLQIRLFTCLLLLIAGRIANFLIPFLYKKVVDEFSDIEADNKNDKDVPSFYRSIWPYVVAWLGLIFLQGGGFGSMGLMSQLRTYLMIAIQQSTARRAATKALKHLLDLDLHFHLTRKTGEVLRTLDRGTSAVQTVLSALLFQVMPTLADIGIACSYFAAKFNLVIAIVTLATLGSYIPLTIFLTQWRVKFRREMNQKDNAKSHRATDALLNYETVKIFGNEAYEVDRYGIAIREYQKREWKTLSSLALLNSIQTITIITGLAVGVILCVQQLRKGHQTVGDAVFFISYIMQLYTPLNFFGTYYRTIQQALVDMENMFELLQVKPITENVPDSPPLSCIDGSVVFDKVSFGYPSRKEGTEPDAKPKSPEYVLRSISFHLPAGGTLGIVGPTGAGKSTILRLLFRFYDPIEGAILIDGQNISSVSLSSLRSHIGVVPQDTVLFNDTIKYNIAYGSLDATDEEVEEAARLAQIHDVIIDRFPEGYETLVGERGLRLSGGEKQRVALARFLLKRSRILVLDEATSALDVVTERAVQSALSSRSSPGFLLGVNGPTTKLVVAHRLSTIMDADEIIVLSAGSIIERGPHNTLLQQQGKYADMWQQQDRDNEQDHSTSENGEPGKKSQ